MNTFTELERRYADIYNRTLRARVLELANEYPTDLDSVCTELNATNKVNCTFRLSELVAYYCTME